MPAPQERQNIRVQSERTVLAAVRLPESVYDPRDPFGELRELVAQAGGMVVGELEQRRDKPEAGTYIGSGKLDELKGLCEAVNATTVIFDHDLSPKQIANIEKHVSRKVLDRSELILDIFAGRATTYEAKLQVEIAQLEYTYPRLRAMWDHLERIVGSGGIAGVGTRGPGEQQLEIDRRLVQRRKDMLQRELREVQERKRREVRERTSQHFTVGLVGYTNAGKSTVFNTMTAGGAYADDRVFATLMTRTREWDLGGGVSCMLSDTVGFVRDLPHHLVASFRATLEEATHADVLLVVLDVSDPSADLHFKTVTKVLDELVAEVAQEEAQEAERARRNGADRTEIPVYTPPERILLLNKADRLMRPEELAVWQSRVPGAIPLCALPAGPGRPEPAGQRELIARVRERVLGEQGEYEIVVPMREARAVHLFETRGRVLEREYEGENVRLRARVGARLIEQVRKSGVRLEVRGPLAGDGAAGAEGVVPGSVVPGSVVPGSVVPGGVVSGAGRFGWTAGPKGS
jgi:GTP-binding protein HflX